MTSAQIDWLSLDQAIPDSVPRVDIGQNLHRSGAPKAQLLLTIDESAHLFVALRSTAEECFPFQDARLWRGLLVIGWGCAFYVIHLETLSHTRYPLDTYFGSIAVGTDFGRVGDYLLVACGERVRRIDEEGQLMWVSDIVGLDGVIINDVSDTVIRGHGEWDPPDGWKPFRVCLTDGTLLHTT